MILTRKPKEWTCSTDVTRWLGVLLRKGMRLSRFLPTMYKNRHIYASPRVVTDITQCYFYHTIDLPEIGTVEGNWDLRAGLHEYLGNFDFRGKRVLDIGTANGILSFWMEKHGAEVISFDLDKEGDWDGAFRQLARV